MLRFAPALSMFALMATAPLGAQEAARDFQLPPAPAPTQESRVQGPVDTEGAVPIRPRAIETARSAAPTAETPSPAQPRIVLPAPAATSRAPAARAPVIAATAAAPGAAQAVAPPLSTPLPPIGQSSGAETIAAAPFPAVTVPTSAPPATNAVGSENSPSWLWLVIDALAAAAVAAAFYWLRRRQAVPHTPTILAPLAANAPVATEPSEALAINVEAMRMDRSVMNATVGYRVTVRNRTAQAVSRVAVEADLVSASKDRPPEMQLASPDQALTPRHSAERLAPGQSLRFEGQVRLPLAEASAIWQGRVGLLVPLLRVRATAAEAEPIATTLVIGRRESGAARPQPFRLDEPPRSYAPLAQRVLDTVPERA